ncbi:TrmH family RNA methyltransferase [Alteromonas oceanisediminis]|uniref:TrmH family RNA methyltransferase n=1 Tax=Alteromonas oceanisediminis TaxID=2836180 RepID=UPI001BD97262|nr:RNA methyltransferase [Alteromonas oceanisediminis]MBT0587811.1 RNA methyltransferase [Alteromonas oceanisediminis]
MKLDDLKKLHQKKYRTQFGYYLVEGEHLLLELSKAYGHNAERSGITVYVTEAYRAKTKNALTVFETITVSEKHMAHISDTKTPQGVVACVPITKVPDSSMSVGQDRRCIYLYEPQDPGNLGTILRSLAWFGGFQLLLSPNSVDPFNPKVVRASMGAIFHVPMELDVSLDTLQARFERFAYLDLQGDSIRTPAFSAFDCYLFGNEARGVPATTLAGLNAKAFTIAGTGDIESLNLASAVGMCAFQLSA